MISTILTLLVTNDKWRKKFSINIMYKDFFIFGEVNRFLFHVYSLAGDPHLVLCGSKHKIDVYLQIEHLQYQLIEFFFLYLRN